MNGPFTISGLGVVGGFGCGVDALNEALRQGKPTGAIRKERPSGPSGRWPGHFADTDALTGYVEKRHLRRIDHFTRLTLLCGFLALDDASLLAGPRPRLGIILATGNGATANQFDGAMDLNGDNEIFGSPTKFAASVHNAAAATLAILLKERGPNLTVSQFDQSMGQAFLSALHWLREGRVETVLVGGVDEYNYAAGALWRDRFESRPAGKSDWRPPAMVGEGAAFFVVTSPEQVEGAAKTYATLENVHLGRCQTPGQPPGLGQGRPLILGADGYNCCHSTYARMLPPTIECALYTGLYGGVPIGQAFDVAIAALALSQNCFFPPVPPWEGFMAPMHMIEPGARPASNGIDILKLTVAQACSLISLSAC